MLFPDSVTIGGIKIKIVIDELEVGCDDFGELKWDEREIHVTRITDTDLMWTTLLHELTHAVFYVSGIHWTLEALNIEVEETLVRMTEHLLLPVLEDLILRKHSNE